MSAKSPSKRRFYRAERVPGPIITSARWFQRTGVSGQILALVVIVGVFAIGTRGKYLSWPNIEVILRLAGIPAILAVGLHQTIVLGGIDLSVEGVAALCIVFVGFLLKNTVNSNDVGLLIVPIVLAVGGSAGIVTGLVHTKLRIPSFIGSLGMYWILYGVAVYINRATQVPLINTGIQSIEIGRAHV